MATKKAPPTREQLVALAKKLNDAPTIGNERQADLWNSIGRVDGWAALSPEKKAEYRASHDQLK